MLSINQNKGIASYKFPSKVSKPVFPLLHASMMFSLQFTVVLNSRIQVEEGFFCPQKLPKLSTQAPIIHNHLRLVQDVEDIGRQHNAKRNRYYIAEDEWNQKWEGVAVHRSLVDEYLQDQ